MCVCVEHAVFVCVWGGVRVEGGCARRMCVWCMCVWCGGVQCRPCVCVCGGVYVVAVCGVLGCVRACVCGV